MSQEKQIMNKQQETQLKQTKAKDKKVQNRLSSDTSILSWLTMDQDSEGDSERGQEEDQHLKDQLPIKVKMAPMFAAL